MIPLVVAAERRERAQTDRVREEDLRAGVDPHLHTATHDVNTACQLAVMTTACVCVMAPSDDDLITLSNTCALRTHLHVCHSVEVRHEVVEQTLTGARQERHANQQDQHEDVWRRGREVHHLHECTVT